MEHQIQGFMILIAIGVWHYMSGTESQVALHNLLLTPSSGELLFHKRSDGQTEEQVLSAIVGIEFNQLMSGGNPTKCKEETAFVDVDSICLQWDRLAKLQMRLKKDEQDFACYEIHWATLTRDADPHDCFQIGENNWYGGAHLPNDHWAIEKEAIQMMAFLPQDLTKYDNLTPHNFYGPVLERYWLSSNGVTLVVEDDVPLHVGVNNSHLCIKATFDDSFYQSDLGELPTLNYTVCVGKNVKHVHQKLSNIYWAKPIGQPAEVLFKNPLWLKDGENVTQEDVLEFTSQIRKHEFPASHLELTVTNPTLDFELDLVKFPMQKNMTHMLHEFGLKVILSVTPFTTIGSRAFLEGTKKGYFLKVGKARRPVTGIVEWLQELGAILDPTNENALAWFKTSLKNSINTGIDHFRIEGCEVNLLPEHFHTHEPLVNPGDYCRTYVTETYQMMNNVISAGIGYKSQNLSLMIRMMSKASCWDYERGLRTLIPSALLFGLLGYPFVLPDVIGGNVCKPFNEPYHRESCLPDKELYIRWLQITAFMPFMQFSVGPWQYKDAEILEIARKYVRLHADYVTPKVLLASAESVSSGAPIVRPLWWLAPDDVQTYAIDSQFLLGDDVMVAPILEQNSTERDIYLPSGMWRDMLRNSDLKGPRTLRDYAVKLTEIAFFELRGPAT